MKPITPDKDGVLERNVTTLLEAGGEAPRIADGGRARIRVQLVEQYSAPARRRSPLIAVGLGLAATAVAALIITRVVTGGDVPGAVDGKLPDGTSWIVQAGARVEVLAARRVRVTGAALLDVARGEPFVVETAAGTIEVLGTRFVVEASASRTTTAVVRGAVKLATASGDVVLRAGEQGVAEPGRAPTRGPAPRLSHLASWAAQARREDAPIQPLRNGTLFARDPNRPNAPESPLPIQQLGIDIVVENQVARVALDQTFHNPAGQTLEGMYRFAIPPDAALQRLAMYVAGTLTESAVVERMHARHIYEDVVYRRLDPALLEWAGTGRLALRVYPLAAREDKRLLLAYTQSLPKLYDDWTLHVPLPEVDLPVGELRVSARLAGCANCEVTSTSHAIEVARTGEDAVVTYRQARATIGDSLVLRVRDARSAATAATHEADGERFVMVRARPEFKIDVARKPAAYKPRTWVILDDVSASRGPLELRAQAALIDGFLRELDEDDRVAVLAFDVAVRQKLAPTRVADVDRAAVRRALADEGGVGGTNFAAALAAANALLAGGTPETASIIYVGDGVITNGPRNLGALRAQLAGRAQFIGVGVGDGPDTQTLDELAAATGGYATAIDLADDLGWRAFDLIAALHTPRVTQLAARFVDASGALVPATAYVKSAQLADGEELELVGKLAGSGTPAAVELTGMVGGAPWQQRIAIDRAALDGAAAGYLPRLWAHRHITARLLAKHEAADDEQAREQRDEAIRKEVVALGKQYFLLSRHTSLLVLEDDAMYKRYGVEKGAGDTWAQYAAPAKIPVATPAVPQPLDDGELVRTQGSQLVELGNDRSERKFERAAIEQEPMRVRRRAYVQGRDVNKNADKADFASARLANVAEGEESLDGGPLALSEGKMGKRSTRGSGPGGGGRLGLRGGVDTRFADAAAGMFDDLTAFVPALFPGDADRWRDELIAASGKPGAIDAAATALLARARRAVPSGVYRWDDADIAVDGARRIGWRRTTGANLAETASFDGAVWTRRYAELGLDVTRALAADDVALALAHLPLWIAEPAHYAHWFDVRATGPREVTLSIPARGQDKARVALVLTFDAQDHLIWIADGSGAELARIEWDGAAPVSARVDREDIAVGFIAQPIADAPAWAHDGTAPGVAVELPLRQPAALAAQLGKLAPGSAEWRHAQRQRMASLVARGEQNELFLAYEALRAHGGVERGDLVLAGSGIVRGTRDEQLAAALAPHRASSPALVRHFEAGRAYQSGVRGAPVPAGAPVPGLVDALRSLREIVSLAAARSFDGAVQRIGAMSVGARELRWAAAAILAQTGAPPDLQARAWDALAVGDHRNTARSNAISVLIDRYWGDDGVARREEATTRIAALVADLDLRAAPPAASASWQTAFAAARRGTAGWHVVWAQWRDKVLASTSFPHVMSLLRVSSTDAPAILARAAELARGDRERTITVAGSAVTNDPALARSLVDGLLRERPTHALHQLAAAQAQRESRTADVLAHLEAAQAAGADEAVDASTARAELRRIVDVAAELARKAPRGSAAQQQAVGKAALWAARWRAIEPGVAAPYEALGRLYLAVGNTAEAWRQLSSLVEDDPMSGAGYVAIADAFEQQGRVAEALEYWQSAIVIEQTDPTPRLRKARALLALGRTADGDLLLFEIANRMWHERHAWIAEQAKQLLGQKRGVP